MVKSVLIVLCLAVGMPALAQPMTIKFAIGSELATTLTGVTDEVIDTEAGPYYFKDVQRLTFQVSLPDSTTIERLRQKNIEVYLRSKRVTPLVTKAAPVPVSPEKPVAKKDSASVPESRPASIVLPQREYRAKSSAGIGLGLDYGGIGMKVTLAPTSPVSVFGGLGFNLDKVGYNLGLELNFQPQAKTTGFLSAMYGYNAVLIRSSGSTSTGETFYGPSFGIGLKSRSRASEDYFTFQVIYPIRDAAFINAPKSINAWPVLVSLGYNFAK